MWDYIARWFEECCRCVPSCTKSLSPFETWCWDRRIESSVVGCIGKRRQCAAPSFGSHFNDVQVKCVCRRRTINTTAPAARSTGSLDHLELSLVEFCQLVDFLLDIVSLVSLVFHVYLTFALSTFPLSFYFTAFVPPVLTVKFFSFVTHSNTHFFFFYWCRLSFFNLYKLPFPFYRLISLVLFFRVLCLSCLCSLSFLPASSAPAGLSLSHSVTAVPRDISNRPSAPLSINICQFQCDIWSLFWGVVVTVPMYSLCPPCMQPRHRLQKLVFSSPA